MPAARQLVDLHLHSTASDGQLTPTELVDAARRAGLRAIALTDHDTVSGLPEALAAGDRLEVEVLSGIELSAIFPEGAMHILGYGFDYRQAELLRVLAECREQRDQRNRKILARLAELGVPITMADVLRQAGGETVGRPHLAQALIAAGHVRTVDEAFQRYLARGAAAYFDRRRLTPQETVDLLRRAGGLAVLAHPMQLKRPMREVREIVRQLAGLGLEGLEVYHPDHSGDDVRALKFLAEELDLAVTGGSDFHGAPRREYVVGAGRSNLLVHYRAVTAIKERLARRTMPH